MPLYTIVHNVTTTTGVIMVKHVTWEMVGKDIVSALRTHWVVKNHIGRLFEPKDVGRELQAVYMRNIDCHVLMFRDTIPFEED